MANIEQQIKELADIINRRVDTNLGQIHGTKSGFGKCADVTTTVDTKLVAKEIYNNGYRKMDEIKKQVAREMISELEYYDSYEGGKTVKGAIKCLKLYANHNYGTETDK